MAEVTRFILAGLAVCWLAVGAAALRGRRRDVARHGPVRWHRAVATLEGWSATRDDPPVAATWCRPLVRSDVAGPRLPRQRDRQSAATDESELSCSPRLSSVGVNPDRH